MPVTSPRATSRAYRGVPLTWANLEEQVRLMAMAINSLRAGKINAIGTVTLTANAATTTLSDIRIGRDSLLLLVPTTANASAEFANGTIYQTYPNANIEAAVINHANNAQTDRTFGYAVLG